MSTVPSARSASRLLVLSVAVLVLAVVARATVPARGAPGSAVPARPDAAPVTDNGSAAVPASASGPQPPFVIRDAILGQLGGPAVAAAHVANTAFVGVGARVYALDVGDPVHPVLVGQSRVMPGEVNDLVTDGRFVFVAQDAGLTVLDGADPARLPVTDEYPTRDGVGDVALNEHYAYLSATGQTFPIDIVLDVGDPWSLRYVTDFAPPAPKYDVAILGRRAYATENMMLHTFDLTDPAFPVEIDGLFRFLDDYALGVAADSQHVFVGRTRDMLVLNADDREAFPLPSVVPTPTGFPTPQPTDTPPRPLVGTWFDSLATAHLSLGHSGASARPDVPAQPIAIVATGGPVNHIVLRDSLAYLAAGSAGGLRIVDVSNAASPVTIGTALVGNARHVDLNGNDAYVSAGGDGLAVVDVADPTTPRRLPTDPVAAWDETMDVAWRGNTAYVAGRDSGLVTVDVTDPAAPRLIARVPEVGRAERLEIEGSFAYVLSGSDQSVGRLAIVDVSDPAAPRATGTISTTGPAEAIDVSAGRAYVAAYGAGLRIFDVTNPNAPHEVSSIGVGEGYAKDVLVDGTLAYVVDRTMGLRIIDVTDPTAPRDIGQYGFYTQFESRGVAKDGARLLVSGSTEPIDDWHFTQPPEHILVIDVADPAHPALERSIDLPVYSREMVVAGNRAYVASYGDRMEGQWAASAVVVVDLSGATPPIAARVPDGELGLAVKGDVALVAAGRAGLVSVAVGPEVAPTATSSDTPLPYPTITRPPITRTATPTRVRYPTTTVPPMPTPEPVGQLSRFAYLPMLYGAASGVSER
jgi:hypothetical protein